MISKARISVAAVALVAMSGVGFAASHSQGEFAREIKARQAQMTLNAFNLGILGAMAKGEMEYDAEAAGLAASNLAASSSIWMPTAWPEGSDNASTEGTRALPAIWAGDSDIGAKAQALSEAVAALQTAAGTDLEALRGAIGPVGAACGGCHKAYRAEE
ncbi:c-type cytochrome [Ruegeria marina]|uniref:Cytochrome c556 n=1 Tax=Ruegeria marina TaxID=639004 RepID=A0A1G6J6G7_9RHOB|nr:cytochrome c [Ruegeria marina]SDC14300.1 Cytochrome c556 [Ruegeria marina]